MPIEGYTFECDKEVRMITLTMPEQFIQFETPKNSMSTWKTKVYLIPVFLYNHSQVGNDGKVVVLVEGIRKDKFLMTFVDQYQTLKDAIIQKDILVKYWREESNSNPTRFKRFFKIMPLSNRLIKGVDISRIQIPTEEEMIEAAKLTLKEREEKIIQIRRAYNVDNKFDDLIDSTYS